MVSPAPNSPALSRAALLLTLCSVPPGLLPSLRSGCFRCPRGIPPPPQSYLPLPLQISTSSNITSLGNPFPSLIHLPPPRRRCPLLQGFWSSCTYFSQRRRKSLFKICFLPLRGLDPHLFCSLLAYRSCSHTHTHTQSLD